jgi:ferric-dicitrate binding protein FerR (iron transport regulator)
MRTKEEIRKDNREYQKRWIEKDREHYLAYKREWNRKKRLQNSLSKGRNVEKEKSIYFRISSFKKHE